MQKSADQQKKKKKAFLKEVRHRKSLFKISTGMDPIFHLALSQIEVRSDFFDSEMTFNFYFVFSNSLNSDNLWMIFNFTVSS